MAPRSFFVLISFGGYVATHFIRKIFRNGLVRFRCFNAFRGRASEEPAGQSASRTTRSVCRSRLAGNARLRFFRFNLRFEAFRLGNRSRRSCFRYRTPAIFRERFARQYKRFFRGIGWRGRTRSVGTAIVKVTAGATIVATALRIATAAISTAVSTTIAAARFAALWRSVLGRRKIACASLAESAATAPAASAATTTASKTSSAAAAAKTLPITATVTAAAIAASVATSLTTPVTGAARAVARRWTILGGVVAGSKILRSGFVRIGLALFFEMFNMRFFDTWSARFGFFDMRMHVVLLGIAV